MPQNLDPVSLAQRQEEARRALLIPARVLQDACRLYLERLGDDAGKAARLIRSSHRELFVAPVGDIVSAWTTARVDLAGSPIEAAYRAADFDNAVAPLRELDDHPAHHEQWDQAVRDLGDRVDRFVRTFEAPTATGVLDRVQLEIINVLASSEANTGKLANQLAIRRALAPPPAASKRWTGLLAVVEAMVPRYFERGGQPGNIAYKLTVDGWLHWNRFGDVREVLRAFLAAYHDQYHRLLQINSVSWEDLKKAGANPAHAHIAATAGSAFFPFDQSTLSGETSAFGRPIDIDDILSCEDVDAFIEYRRRTSFARASLRNEHRKELDHATQRAIDIVYGHFTRDGAWPSTRRIDVEFRRTGIPLRHVCATRFVRGYDLATENGTTKLTLAGIAEARAAEKDRASIVSLLRHLGTQYQTYPEARTVEAEQVAKALGISVGELERLGRLLSESSTVLMSSNSQRTVIHVTDRFQDYLDASTLEDVLLADQESREFSPSQDWFDHPSPAPPALDELDAEVVDEDFVRSSERSDEHDDNGKLTASLIPLGEGTYGQVYRSQDRFRRDIAVKFIRASKAEQAGVIGHAEAMARAKHPAMVTLHDVWTLTDPNTGTLTPALVMEFLDGVTLEELERPFTLDEFRQWANTLLSFLRRIHDARTHHGDLHTNNVMITEDGLRILDPYHRDSQVALSTRTAESWRLQDVLDGRRLLETILVKTHDADDAITAFRAYKPRLTSLDDLAAAVEAALVKKN